MVVRSRSLRRLGFGLVLCDVGIGVGGCGLKLRMANSSKVSYHEQVRSEAGCATGSCPYPWYRELVGM